MSADTLKDRAQLNRDQHARTVAKLWVRAHHLPEGYRKFLIYVLSEWIDEHRIFFVGTRALAERTDISRPTVIALMNEFIAKGVVAVLNQPERGGRRICRLDYERIAEAYPQRSKKTSKRDRKADNELDHLEESDASNGERKVDNRLNHFDNSLSVDNSEKWTSFNGHSGQVFDDKVDKFSFQSGQANCPEQYEHLTPEQCAQPPRGLAAPPSASAAASPHAKNGDAMRRSKKAAARSDGKALTPFEITSRIEWMMTVLRSNRIAKGSMVPVAISKFASDPRMSRATFDEAMRRYYLNRDFRTPVRTFAKMVEAVLNEQAQKKRKKRQRDIR